MASSNQQSNSLSDEYPLPAGFFDFSKIPALHHTPFAGKTDNNNATAHPLSFFNQNWLSLPEVVPDETIVPFASFVPANSGLGFVQRDVLETNGLCEHPTLTFENYTPVEKKAIEAMATIAGRIFLPSGAMLSAVILDKGFIITAPHFADDNIQDIAKQGSCIVSVARAPSPNDATARPCHLLDFHPTLDIAVFKMDGTSLYAPGLPLSALFGPCIVNPSHRFFAIGYISATNLDLFELRLNTTFDAYKKENDGERFSQASSQYTNVEDCFYKTMTPDVLSEGSGFALARVSAAISPNSFLADLPAWYSLSGGAVFCVENGNLFVFGVVQGGSFIGGKSCVSIAVFPDQFVLRCQQLMI